MIRGHSGVGEEAGGRLWDLWWATWRLYRGELISRGYGKGQGRDSDCGPPPSGRLALLVGFLGAADSGYPGLEMLHAGAQGGVQDDGFKAVNVGRGRWRR